MEWVGPPASQVSRTRQRAPWRLQELSYCPNPCLWWTLRWRECEEKWPRVIGSLDLNLNLDLTVTLLHGDSRLVSGCVLWLASSHQIHFGKDSGFTQTSDESLEIRLDLVVGQLLPSELSIIFFFFFFQRKAYLIVHFLTFGTMRPWHPHRHFFFCVAEHYLSPKVRAREHWFLERTPRQKTTKLVLFLVFILLSFENLSPPCFHNCHCFYPWLQTTNVLLSHSRFPQQGVNGFVASLLLPH